MIDLENIERKTLEIIKTPAWVKLQKYYNQSTNILFIGNGGNLAIADHAAIDASRLTNKNIICPGSGILSTSLISDTSFKDWLKNWVDVRTRGLNLKKTLLLGFSCSTSGESSDSIKMALSLANTKGIPTALISAQHKDDLPSKTLLINQDVHFYHSSEILSLILTYELIHGAGFECPSISAKAQSRKFNKLGIIKKENFISSAQYPPGFEKDQNNIAIDFDGVIHNFDKGWHDGTCYGKPIKGSLEAIKKISKKYKIIIFSSKVLPNRPLVNGKTGYELVQEWLTKYKFKKYISEITHEKPRAEFYIDDKAILFENNWNKVLKKINVK